MSGHPAAIHRLRASMERLVRDKGMLTGLTVCYGNASHCHSVSVGLAREVVRTDGEFREAPVPITGDSLYDLASLTKLFTLVSALMLIERGKMAFEDSVSRLDPRFGALDGCTLLDLLSYEAVLKTPQRVDAQKDREAALGQVFRTGRAPEEGEKLYSDMNALVLKYLVEAVSGQKYDVFLRENILGPLDMRDTWVRVPREREARLLDYNHEHRILNGRFIRLDDIRPGLPHDPKAVLGTAGRIWPGTRGFSRARGICAALPWGCFRAG